jgi:hypothetical protein
MSRAIQARRMVVHFCGRTTRTLVFGPNYENLLGRLKLSARNVLRARGETVTDVEITTVQSGEAAMALWVIPAGRAGVIGAASNADNCN